MPVDGRGERRPHGQDDPALEHLRDSARSLADRAGYGRGLLEVGRIGIQDERLAPPELVLEKLGQALVPPLGHTGRLLCGRLHLRIVVDIKMLGLEHLEVEAVVLHLVLPEILG